MTDRAQLRSELEASGKRVSAAISGLSEEQASAVAIGDWSVKDHLNHMCHWHEFRAMEIMRISRGGQTAFPPFSDQQLEVVNRTFVELRRGLPLAQAVEDLQFARAMVIEAVANCPEEALEESRYGECGIEAGIAHDNEHAETIEAWRKREGI
ncbi:MAG: ClbS/DfsB family four-helix bundle protein [Chloroflexi bacterium]|nr:ClbS/DfsB family four-helix bundle protein [Chloroflexota bacterium]